MITPNAEHWAHAVLETMPDITVPLGGARGGWNGTRAAPGTSIDEAIGETEREPGY